MPKKQSDRGPSTRHYIAPKAARPAAHDYAYMQPLVDHSNAPEMEADEGKLSTPRQRLLAAVDLDGVIETEPRSPVQEGTPWWRTLARIAAALKDDETGADRVEADGFPS